ncbi:NADPH-dependent 7-cyano-7-deazaguanine reductase QueF [Niveibacterium sp. 24ML]|uniref:NADPH-dependent 7-cyano-7-deazaguanine reductase QueF n=1 Tax=Niveibacterium sp. 24ML TaxID=2985512 RepID=UPI002271FCA9|nr:NADPH-dependent 7-cyano-7-deazaguanine reductase QueF [Niveibacterium sp. 24ML]MCX9157479.1 NADPH-dependent 7-cyano-7-deazaguanine reductase QueF [Niveibacterium sp. 24ML]
MTQSQNPSNAPEASPLGKAVSYCDQYAPQLLFPIPRSGKRAEIGLGEDLPFTGHDLWNAYELSWLNARGKPMVALGTLQVPAQSPCLIESKSLKLYFNSFNQTRFESVDAVRSTIMRDLSAAAGAPVLVQIETLDCRPQRELAYPEGVLLDTLDIAIDTYEPRPELLRASGAQVDETLYSHLLKSNCLVTGQPDWGMLVVRYRGASIDREGLLRYICSFRTHNEFHEQCVERIFVDITRQCSPDRLEVWARYTRRGGLDINPWRSSIALPGPGNQGEVRQ